jgi:hypothetical protein
LTDFQTSTVAREVLESTTGQVSISVIAREVLLSQVSQLWTSVLAREVLLTNLPSLGGQTFVIVNSS